MPKLQAYNCDHCGTSFEFLHHPVAESAECPSCRSSDVVLQPGGHTFSVIVPMYPGALRRKAGHVHKYANRPAERVAVSVPRAQGDLP